MAHQVDSDAQTSHFRSASRNPGPLTNEKPGLNGSITVKDAERSSRIQNLAPRVWIAFAVLSVLALAYLISLIVRTPDQSWTWLDGWGVAIFEVLVSILCVIRRLDRHHGRAAPLALGLGLMCWSLGDAFLTFESLGGATPSVPSIADVFYLGFYPLAYVATVRLLRTAMGRLSRPNWLDGVVAGLGAAAICATFAFHDIVHASGSGVAEAATNLVYPIGDLLLLSLVIGGTVMLSGRWTMPWFLLASGITINVVGDTANLFQSSTVFASRFGTEVNAFAWPASALP